MQQRSKIRLVVAWGAAMVVFLTGCAGAVTPKARASGATYVLVQGDSFYRVAGKFGIDPVDLASANGLSLSSMLHPGQKLKIPGRSGESTNPAPTTVKAPQQSQDEPTVSEPEPTTASAVGSSSTAPKYAISNSQRATIVRLAKSKMNSTYQWGAVGPSKFDCSGFAYWLYNQAGVKIPRLTSSLYAARSVAVSQEDLLPGDLVFFHTPVSHMGVYIGDGMMAEAASSDLDMRISSVNRASLVKFGRL